MGVDFEGVKRDKMGEMGRMRGGLNGEEWGVMEEMVKEGYGLFRKGWGEGGNMGLEEVWKIGEGGVWRGSMGKEVKVVEEVGGVDSGMEVGGEVG